jgi:SAM-dependent methyltransferase
VVGTTDGILNFVTDPDLRLESEHFDQEYQEQTIREPRSLEALGQLWTDYPNAPMNRSMLERIGSVKGSTILLLGNGVLVKELYLLTQDPAALVFSDLSIEAVRTVRDYFGIDDDDNAMFFAAIDAQQLPFDDESVDIVYGYYFVHHLPDTDRFLAEVARVLRPGGKAVFLDNAMSPLWQKAKLGVLHPLMNAAHRYNPISEEDMRVTLGGGFDVKDFDRRIRNVGGDPFFDRSGFVHYFATRASDIFMGEKSRFHLGRREWIPDGAGGWRLVAPHRRLLRVLIRIDSRLERLRVVRENQIRLVWGFTMPSPSTSQGHR